ncbi:MAG TPA: hypothetical protein VGN65_13655 [Casimicrobiaceae bacterium]
MKTAVTAVALALFGLAPAMGAACEYNDASSASANPVEQMASASTPAATKVPTAPVAKAGLQSPAKPAVVKVRQASDPKVAVSSTH